MLDLIARFKHYIRTFHVLLYEQEGESLRLKAELTMVDNSTVRVKEYLFANQIRKYAYHWVDETGELICRWDNAKHWPNLPTFPHHKHTNQGVFESTETSLGDVLMCIKEKIDNEAAEPEVDTSL